MSDASKKMQSHLEKAKKTWSLTPVLPEQFARFNGAVHIVLDGAPYVVVIAGRDLDKLKTVLPAGYRV